MKIYTGRQVAQTLSRDITFLWQVATEMSGAV